MIDAYEILFDKTKEYILKRVRWCLVEVTPEEPWPGDPPTSIGKPIKVKLTPELNGEIHPEWSVVFIIDDKILQLNSDTPDDMEYFLDYYLNEALVAAAKSMFLEPKDIPYSF